MKSCTCHIITRDDESTIGECLDSAISSRLFTNILILIDTKSADNTGRIIYEARLKYPQLIRIIPYKWEDPQDFAQARNFCLANTLTNYAFWLDGDEKIQHPEQIRAMLHKAHGQAFQFWIISPLYTGGFHNMYQPRLVPVRRGVYFECPVLERIDFSLKRNGIPIEQTSFEPVLHATGYADQKLVEQKNKRNRRIMEKFLKKGRSSPEAKRHIEKQYYRIPGRA